MRLSLLVPMPDRAYRVEIGRGVLERVPDLLAEFSASSVVLVHDEHLADHANALANQLGQTLSASFCVPSGEESKSFAMLEKLSACVLNADPVPDRGCVVLALGGGVVGDLAGFFASIYLRGVRVLHLPSTFLAMVDSAIGGKTAINHGDAKNQLGTFHQPSGVLADLALLDSLPEREFCAALAEAVKCGVVLDDKLFAFLEVQADALLARDDEVICRVVSACARDKARVVVQDERESGVRAVLNYGHTLGHAIEQASGYARKHGEAVAIGMRLEARIGEALGITAASTVQQQEALLDRFGLPQVPSDGFARDQVLRGLKRDKKRSGAKLKLILPERLGEWREHAHFSAETLLDAAADAGLKLA